jgi:signal transduction histidine kinase
VCYITDNITSRRKMEISLLETLEKERELSEMKSRFVATASHEFRTPLTTIMSSAELLKQFRDRMTAERVEDHLLRIIRQVKYMTTLIDDLLVLGKAQSGKLEFTPQLLDINALCLEILDHMGETLKNSVQVSYVSQYTCDLRPFDPRLLRLIVSNLLSNAAKYSPKGSQVRFELRCAPAETVLIVQDHGMGIPEKDLLHIFKPFYRAGNVGTIGGTGLGLSIIRQAVELHGGTVELESQEGAGTKFTVRLPLPAEAAR